MTGKHRLAQLIDEKQAIFTDVNDAIWGFAETRFSLPQSADALCKILTEQGFQLERGCVGMEHAFIASYGSGKPVIGILAEYDALPNISQVAGMPKKEPLIPGGSGHGCGHNALGAGALAGAVGIKDYMQEAGLSGTIKFFGCPAEESGSGKAFMARGGIFDGLDSILTWHPMNETAAWRYSSLANYQVYFNFKGVSSHAAAAPQYGRSALDAVELMSVGVNYLREHVVQEARIHYAYIDAGGVSPNVVQPTAKVLYFIRAPHSDQLKEIYERVVQIAQGAALMSGTTMEIEWDSACAEYLVNEPLTKAVFSNMEQLGAINFTKEELDFAAQFTNDLDEMAKATQHKKIQGFFKDKDEKEIKALSESPLMSETIPYNNMPLFMPGSTDVGDASWQAPTAQFTTVCYPAGTVPHSWQYVACGKSSITHKGMLYAGKIIAMTALDVLENPALLKEAKEEHNKKLGVSRYYCPIPEDVHPK